MRSNHTSAIELAELASQVNPELLVLYHVLFMGSNEDELISEIRQQFSGDVIIASDLDVY